jgi:hypothetical protein
MSDRILCLRVMEGGACSTSRLSPDDWYPVSASAEDARDEAADAIVVCAACRVRAECLELAVRNWTVGQHGVWGGTVPAERERLRSGRVAQLTRVLARNRDADLAASRDTDRAASLLAPGHSAAFSLARAANRSALMVPSGLWSRVATSRTLKPP